MNLIPNAKQVPEMTKATDECPRAYLYSAYDGMATEVEVLEFLYGLVRLLKPEFILETGSYLGHGTYHLAQAAKDNGVGKVFSAETVRAYGYHAMTLLLNNGLGDYAIVKTVTGKELIEQHYLGIDFAFLDSALTVRVEEAELVLPKLRPNGVILVHDTCSYYTNNHPEGKGPREDVIAFAKKHDLSLMLFNNPRGLALMRRKDY